MVPSLHTKHCCNDVSDMAVGMKTTVGLRTGIPPISVCLTVGLSSWYWHMRRRSASVSVFRGVDEVRDWVEVAETGVADAGVMGGGAEGNSGAWYVDWLVSMLGHWGICGMIRGCSWACVVLVVG